MPQMWQGGALFQGLPSVRPSRRYKDLLPFSSGWSCEDQLSASAPATVRIGDGRPVKVEPLKAQGHAFQLMAEEAKAAPYVVAGTFLFSISVIVFVLCLLVVPMISYVFSKFFACFGLFDLAASRSFVSQNFSRGFSVLIDDLECSLRVSIANEHGVSASSVYRGCELEISGCLSR